MSVHGINGKSGSTIHPLTDIRNKSTEGTTNSALPEGTPLPPIQGGGLIHAASAEIPGDTPGSTVSPNKFGNPMADYEAITQQIQDAEDALKVMEEKLKGYEATEETLTEELGKAIEALDEANATLEALDEAKDDLEKAIKALEEKTNPTEKDKKALEKGKGLLIDINNKIGTATTAGTAMAAVEEAKAKMAAIDADIKTAKANQENKEKEIEDKEELIKQWEAQQKDSEEFGPNGDLDGDGVENHLDPDIDGDGLSNAIEGLLGLNPFSVDSDNDGVKDSGEIILSLKATDNADLTKKLKELMAKAGKGEDPFAGLDFNPLKADSNGDGIIDKLQVPEKFPKQWASFIYTNGGASGTAGTSSGEGASAETPAIDWAPPSKAALETPLEYDNKPGNEAYGTGPNFEVPFSPEDKVLNLSIYPDDTTLKKSDNDLILKIVVKKPGAAAVTYEWKFKDFFNAAGKAQFKLYLFDKAEAAGKQAVDSLTLEDVDLAKINNFDEWGNHTGGIYLSTGEEQNKEGEWKKYGNTYFSSISKLEDTPPPAIPQNPFDNETLKLEAKDDNGVPTITLKKSDIYSNSVGNPKTTTFNFPSEYEGKKLDKWKVTTIDDTGNEHLILDAIDKDGKVIVRYKLVGLDKEAAIGTDPSYALNFQMANGGQLVDFMEVDGWVKVQGGDGDDVIKLKAGEAWGNGGSDMIIAGDGIENDKAPILNKSPTGKLGVIAHGGDGDDWIFGGSAYDQLYGDDGWDYLESGGGTAMTKDGKDVELDQLFGGAGNDILTVQDSKGYYTVDGGAETDETNAVHFVNTDFAQTLEKGVWSLNGYLDYLQEKWAQEFGMTLAEVKKAYEDGMQVAEFASENLKTLMQNIAMIEKAEKEAKFAEDHKIKETEKKDEEKKT